MSTRTRAIVIAMLGPSVQGVGLLWMFADAVLSSGRDFTLRYVLFDPAPLMIAVGLALSAICVPIALQVAEAEPEELDLREPAGPVSGEASRRQREYFEGGWEASE